MTSEPGRLSTEVAHVLFLDIVGFSQQSMEEQARLTSDLRQVVRGTPEFVRAQERQEMLGIDTGDGMALVFFRDPLAPVQCATEIARALAGYPRLKLRMGVHSGPVSRVTDLNGRENVTGSGINTSQRVMDCGDPGHILLSSASAEVVREFEAWAGSLHDLGDVSVKHGQRVHLYNLVMGGVGNAAAPSRVANPLPNPPPASGRESEPTPNPSLKGRESEGPLPGPPLAKGRELEQEGPHPNPLLGKERESEVTGAMPLALERHAPEPDWGPGGRDQGSKRVVLLYKRGSADDEHVLQLLEQTLRANGDDVFIDRHLQIGVAWAQEIEKRIREADAIVPLISETSQRSEMLEYEITTAHQAAQAQGGKPRILPVRVGFTATLGEPLGGILNPLQYTLWSSPSDDARVAGDLIKALHAPPPPSVPLKREAIGGAVPLDSKFYVVRPTDDAFLEAIAGQDSIVLVKGARQMGKTSLLARGLQQARTAGARVVLTDFQTLSPPILASADTLFRSLAESLVDQLDLDADPGKTWNPDLGANTNLERFVRRQVLGAITEPLVWGLDEVDRLFPPVCEFGSEVFGLFRSWHNRRSLDPTGPWSRLTLAIAYATEAHLFITDLNQSPFNVGTRLTLEDFDLAQVADLNARYGSPMPDTESVARFYALVGGQPYLVRRGLDEAGRRGLSMEMLEAEADHDDGLFGDHLRRILITLSQDADLTEVIRGMLQGKPCPTPESFYRLRSAGLIAGSSASDARFRCRMYQTYLGQHLA